MFGPRARAAGLLYAGSACAGSVMLVLVWQTPIGSAIEEATGFRPALIGNTISSFATAFLPDAAPALFAPPAPALPTAPPLPASPTAAPQLGTTTDTSSISVTDAEATASPAAVTPVP